MQNKKKKAGKNQIFSNLMDENSHPPSIVTAVVRKKMELEKQKGSSYDMEKTLLGPDEMLLVIPIDCATSSTLLHLLGGFLHKLYIMDKQVPRLSSGISLVSRIRTILQAYFNLSIPELVLHSINAIIK